MAWSPTTGAAPTSGYKAQGVTSVRWGTRGLVTNIGGVGGTNLAGQPTSIGVVTRFNQKVLVDNIKLPNGDGLTTTRVQIIDGIQWDVTIRDDSGIASRPTPGTTVAIYDGGGLITNGFLKYTGTVIEGGWETTPKQPGEMTFTVESLQLISAEYTGTA